MKYNYELKILTLSNGRKRLVIRLHEPIKLIETFLSSDIQGGGRAYEWVMEKLEEVENGTSESSSIQGNICRLEIKSDFTRVVDTLNEDSSTNYCVIETSELKELIDIWVSENQKFKN